MSASQRSSIGVLEIYRAARVALLLRYALLLYTPPIHRENAIRTDNAHPTVRIYCCRTGLLFSRKCSDEYPIARGSAVTWVLDVPHTLCRWPVLVCKLLCSWQRSPLSGNHGMSSEAGVVCGMGSDAGVVYGMSSDAGVGYPALRKTCDGVARNATL